MNHQLARTAFPFLALALLGAATFVPARAAARARRAAPPALRVSGTQIVDARGEPVLLRGVNCASMEWSSDGEGHILTTVNTAIRGWHANIIRLPLAQDRWFGKASEQHDDGTAYRALVREVVDACASQSCYVMLDLHWSDAGEWGKQIAQHVMPDRNSLEFWKACAAAFKNEPAVLFDLYNEPHDVSWEIWHDGGTVTERDRRAGTERTYEAAGVQAMLDAVRATGARNVVVIGGLGWAYEMPGAPNGKILSDPNGDGVVYANHAYPFKGESVEKWIARVEAGAKLYPVVVSEWGAEGRQGNSGLTNEQWVAAVLKALTDHRWSWTAWDLHPGAGPRLITDWNYTPTPVFGAPVKAALGGSAP